MTLNPGNDIESARALAATSHVVFLFATQWTAESFDVADLSLPNNQDALITSVAKANLRTIVILETRGHVTMP